MKGGERTGKNGMKHFPGEREERVRLVNEAGESMRALSRKHGVIPYFIESRCGKRPEVNLHQAVGSRNHRPVLSPAWRRGFEGHPGLESISLARAILPPHSRNPFFR